MNSEHIFKLAFYAIALFFGECLTYLNLEQTTYWISILLFAIITVPIYINFSNYALKKVHKAD